MKFRITLTVTLHRVCLIDSHYTYDNCWLYRTIAHIYRNVNKQKNLLVSYLIKFLSARTAFKCLSNECSFNEHRNQDRARPASVFIPCMLSKCLISIGPRTSFTTDQKAK